MSIEINPEQQKLIDAAIRSGAYSDASQVIRRALEMLLSQEEWLSVNRESIHEKISRGIEQLNRGECMSGEEAYRRLQDHKAEYLARSRSTT